MSYTYTYFNEDDFPEVTPSRELGFTEVMTILNRIYAKYQITDDNTKIMLLHKLYNHAFINGTSDREAFKGQIRLDDSIYKLELISEYLSGISRKFFRSLQTHAYKYVTDPANHKLRAEIANKWGGVLKTEDAFVLIDFFDRVIPQSHRVASERVKQRRLSNKQSQLKPKVNETVVEVEQGSGNATSGILYGDY
jgi:hypothetical protein